MNSTAKNMLIGAGWALLYFGVITLIAVSTANWLLSTGPPPPQVPVTQPLVIIKADGSVEWPAKPSEIEDYFKRTGNVWGMVAWREHNRSLKCPK